jgi:hypothetical protein
VSGATPGPASTVCRSGHSPRADVSGVLPLSDEAVGYALGLRQVQMNGDEPAHVESGMMSIHRFAPVHSGLAVSHSCRALYLL